MYTKMKFWSVLFGDFTIIVGMAEKLKSMKFWKYSEIIVFLLKCKMSHQREFFCRNNYKLVFNSTILIFILVICCESDAFNLSPNPNIIIQEPSTYKTPLEAGRRSYFGYSIYLKSNMWVEDLSAFFKKKSKFGWNKQFQCNWNHKIA